MQLFWAGDLFVYLCNYTKKTVQRWKGIYEFVLPENQITDDKWMNFLVLAQLVQKLRQQLDPAMFAQSPWNTISTSDYLGFRVCPTNCRGWKQVFFLISTFCRLLFFAAWCSLLKQLSDDLSVKVVVWGFYFPAWSLARGTLTRIDEGLFFVAHLSACATNLSLKVGVGVI